VGLSGESAEWSFFDAPVRHPPQMITRTLNENASVLHALFDEIKEWIEVNPHGNEAAGQIAKDAF
jgi:hypothetical protein